MDGYAINKVADLSASTNNVTTSSIVTIPANLQVSTISNPGSVSAITLTSAGNYQPASSMSVPTCTISAPTDPSGIQATCQINYLSPFGWPVVSGGSGYVVGDILTYSGGTCSQPFQTKVTSVDANGAVTGRTSYYVNGSGGKCSVTPPVITTMTGGTGSGAVSSGSSAWWVVQDAIQITTAGLYPGEAPSVTISPTNSCGVSCAAKATATLSSQLTISAGSGKIKMGSIGTEIGVVDNPILTYGPIVDMSMVRMSLFAGIQYLNYGVASYWFTQTSTVSAATLGLPTVTQDGYRLRLINGGYAVTALTFAPVVKGWTNGSTLAAYSVMDLYWDNTNSTWFYAK